MKILGHYRELWDTCGDPQESIRDFLGSDRERDAALVRAYLDSGVDIISTMGVDPDVLGGDHTVVDGAGILTDGEYIWRRDLGYYFDTYDLRLPAEFLDRVRELDYRVPPIDDERGMEISDFVVPLWTGAQDRRE
ncbi:hypothetical protein [Actinosynnema sp. NPDC020468]|uniref:hypothetical protein n=1 Tax=Actinosynnema sp. NPDC020468 TaxID=3154488 RepID=UPI0034023CAC